MLGEGEDVSSECSSGCQSGWTTYLDHSSCEPLVYNKGGFFHGKEEEEEEEDLSMVSDASSGPPHFQEEDEHCFYYLHSSTCFGGNGCLCSALVPTAELAVGGGKKRRVEPKQQGKHSSLLDDTASSPPFSSSKTSSFSGDDNRSRGSHMMPPIASVLEFSCGFSATHFKRNHAVEKQMGGYLQSSAPVKPTPSIPVPRKEGGKTICSQEEETKRINV
ncbi:unnamed protein product [Musa banksii]